MSSLHELLSKAVALKASDLHLVAGRSPAYRVARSIFTDDQVRFSTKDILEMVEESVPRHLKGSFQKENELDYAINQDGVGRFRANAFMTRHGPSIAFRHVRDVIPSVEELNLPPILKEMSEINRGIIVVCGSTGSGKSTTLASMIQHVNTNQKRRIITVEDPVEFIFTDDQSIISQREIGLDTLDYHTSLKRLLRQDPDIILIGEMRDAESFSTALTASETGHVVMTTLHTSNAAQSIQRILDFSPSADREQIRNALAENLRVVIAQRLLPGIKTPLIPAVEVMITTPAIRKLILDNELNKLSHAIEAGKEDGMQSFDQCLCSLIRFGKITEQVGLSHSTNPQALEMALRGIVQNGVRRIFTS